MISMYRNFIKIAFRHLYNNRVYTILNIAGLAVGISASILIYLYIQSELSFDRYWKDVDQIYRVTQTLNTSDNSDPFAYTAYKVAPTLQNDYPEFIETTVRLARTGKETIWYNEEVYSEENIYLADTSFFSVFSLELLRGDIKTALSDPASIVISEALSEKVFGDQNPIGKVLHFTTDDLVVTGVISDPTFESHLSINALIPLQLIDHKLGSYKEDWAKLSFFTYLKFVSKEAGRLFKPKLDQFYEFHVAPWLKDLSVDITLNYDIQPVKDIHFNTSYKFDIPTNTDKSYIYLFGSIALFILIIACINYTNLATSRYAIRAKEVAVRKTVGSSRRYLITQFLGESIIISLVAIILAFAITELCLPPFNALTGKTLVFFSSHIVWKVLIFSVLVIIFIGIVAGSYPAIYLSRFMPIHILNASSPKSILRDSGPMVISARWLRKVLVVFQFVVAMLMIVGTLLIVKQTSYMKNQDLGFNNEHLLAVDFPWDTVLVQNTNPLKKELLKSPLIDKVAFTRSVPGIPGGFGRLMFLANRNNKEQETTMNFLMVDFDLLDMLDIELVKGRKFSRTYPSDTSAFVINEAAAKYLGWTDDPIGKVLRSSRVSGKVIGVVKDFHYASLHNQIEPLVIMINEKMYSYIVLKIKPRDFKKTMKYVKSVWDDFAPKQPMEYFFVNQRINSHYQHEESLRTIMGYFAIISIIISIIGLLGLVSFHIEQRQKEIGIRKIMGATPWRIIIHLMTDYARLIVVSAILAFPVSYYLISVWLNEFAYHIKIDAYPFIIAFISVFLISLLIVFFKSASIARSNPADSIKYE